MKLETVIEHESEEKYIVVNVINQEDEKSVLVSLPYKWHGDILSAYKERLSECEVLEVLGGGILNINHEDKRIKTFGQSGSYGKPPIKLVENILMEKFPEYNLDVRVTNYIRD
jgi:hypothetical protein